MRKTRGRAARTAENEGVSASAEEPGTVSTALAERARPRS